MELRFGGCRIRVDFSFPAVLVLLFLCADTAILRQSFAVSILHETGHALAMCLTGAGIREISLTAAGVQMRTKTAFLRQKQELCILLCGPAVNFLMAGILYFLHGFSDAAILHLCAGCFNLLPFSVLDGGSALGILLAENQQLLRIRSILCIMLSIGISAILACFRIMNPVLYLMCFYLAAAQLRVDKQGGMW